MREGSDVERVRVLPMTTWTKPHHGVSHLALAKGIGPRLQVTVEEHASFVDACVLMLDGLHPFTPVTEGTFPSVEEARAWAEQSVATLGGKAS